jgi:hypothetical protein
VDAAASAAPTVRRTICYKTYGKGTHSVQERCGCKDCKKYAIYICSACTHATNPTQKQFFFCNPTLVEGSKCFSKHMVDAHVAKAHKDN